MSAPDQYVRPLRRALVSVYDKRGLEELATACVPPGLLVSTGSTAAKIKAARCR